MVVVFSCSCRVDFSPSILPLSPTTLPSTRPTRSTRLKISPSLPHSPTPSLFPDPCKTNAPNTTGKTIFQSKGNANHPRQISFTRSPAMHHHSIAASAVTSTAHSTTRMVSNRLISSISIFHNMQNITYCKYSHEWRRLLSVLPPPSRQESHERPRQDREHRESGGQPRGA